MNPFETVKPCESAAHALFLFEMTHAALRAGQLSGATHEKLLLALSGGSGNIYVLQGLVTELFPL